MLRKIDMETVPREAASRKRTMIQNAPDRDSPRRGSFIHNCICYQIGSCEAAFSIANGGKSG